MYTTHPKFRPENFHKLGTFQVSSGKLVISDPCYLPGVWCQGTLENVRNGEWHSAVVKGQTDWGNRCWEILAVHKDFPLETTQFTTMTNIDVGVDSGQAGIFDKENFHGGEDDWGDGGWYDKICKITLDSEHNAGVLDGGVVSSSGYGDGSYECKTAVVDNQVVGVQIIFIVLESDEE